MKNRKASDSSWVTTTAHPDLGASAPLPANPEKANVNDNSRSKTSASAERQTYWTSDRYGWLLIVNGEMRARVEGAKVILLTHRDTKPRRLIAPNSQVPFDVAERLIGIPKVDRFEDRGLQIIITSPRPMQERATAAFCERVPKDRELRHYLSEAWKLLNAKATEGGLDVNGSTARHEIGLAIRSLQLSGNKWSPKTLEHIQSAAEALRESHVDPEAPYECSALSECQKARSLIELDPELPRAPDVAAETAPRLIPRHE